MARELIPAYYPRQDVQNVDLNQLFEQDDAAFRAHNRALHGCGVVCGLVVTLCADGQSVEVSPGYALSPWGDEIDVLEAVRVPVNCTELIEVDCNDLNPPDDGGDGEFIPAYIVIRHAVEPGRERLLAPEHCAPRDCTPTRMCDSFEIVCTTRRPEVCAPQIDLACCGVSPILIHRLLDVGDLADSGLFGCAESTEEWITLARVDFQRATDGHIQPRLSLDDRTYIPSTQFIFDLARRVGVQAIKNQLKRSAITGLTETPVTRLRLNRGAEITRLAVHGRELASALSVSMTDPAIPVSIGTREDTYNPLRIHLTIPLFTTSSEVGLMVVLVSGATIHSLLQPVPVLIELIDTPPELIPPLPVWSLQEHQRMIQRLRAIGYTTAQRVAAEAPGTLAFNYSFPNPQGLSMSPLFAAAFVSSTRSWLRLGAPGT